MPKLEIDGISVDADPGTTIIEVADRLNIHIPRFCYHHKLSVAANCRMCLVQVEKSNKALPACATPVADGMKVWTKSKETMAAQHSVMEFLLINHPLDCPICDQGGECELQDVSMQYGRSDSRFTEPKRVVLDNDLGSLIESDMTRCIQCTRCVRFGDEVSGERELGATGRGEHMEIGTYVAQTINSEVSGNIIDLCPVGALTSKPFRFTARPWELTQVPGISPHDCIGSNLYWHIQEHVKRVVPKDTEELNEVWLSDRDRYSYAGLRHADRLHKPLLHKQRWSTAGWMEALKYAASAIKTIVDTHGVNELGVLVTPNATTEELYLLQKFVRGLGCNNIDHRLRQLDFNDQHLAPKYPNLGIDYRSIADLDTILLIGCNLAKEQPLAALRVRKAAKKGAKVCALNCVDYHYNFDIAAKCIVPAANFLASLAALAKELINICNYKADSATTAALASIEVDQQVKSIAASLKSGAKKQIILGHIAQMHPQASQIVALGNLIAQIIGGNCGSFSDGANAAGAWLTGCVPHRLPNGDAAPQAGKNALQMLQTPLRAYILYAVEPEFDSILGVQALDSLLQADVVIAISPYQSDTLLEIADIILPLAHFSEMSGSMININGTQQQFVAALEPFGESRPGWKILRMLGSMTELEGFAFNTLEEVTAEMQSAVVVGTALPKWQAQTLTPIAKTASKDLLRIAPLSLYAVDGLVRRATPLQATEDAHSDPKIIMNAKTAQNLNIVADELVVVTAVNNDIARTIELHVKIDDKVADYTAVIYQANAHTFELGAPYTKLEVRKC